MQRHELDLTSLVAGLVLIGVAAAYLVGHLTDVRVDGSWVAPLALIGLGLAGLAGGVSRVRRGGSDGQQPEQRPE